MAAAGFIHCPSENSPDIVQCLICLKELEGREPEDDSMEEHKKHSTCMFITLRSEFLKLDREWVKRKMHKLMNQHIERFQTLAQKGRGSLEKLDKDEPSAVLCIVSVCSMLVFELQTGLIFS